MSGCRLLNKNLKSEHLPIKPKRLAKKIIYAWDYLEWGGAQIYFFGLINRIGKRAGIKILLPEGAGGQLIEFIKNLNVAYEFFEGRADAAPAVTLRRKLERHWNKFKSENALIRSLEKQDLKNSLVHVELAPWQSLYSLLRLCRKTDVFVTMHNSLPEVPKWRYFWWKIKFRLICRNRNFHIFTSNHDAKKSLRPLVPQRFYKKIRVTHTNVNPDEIAAALSAPIEAERMKARYRIPDQRFLVFCVGQFIDRKGRWVFLEAAQEAFRRDPGLAFVWISNYLPPAAELKMIERYQLGDNFVLINSDEVGKEHLDLFKLMRLADVFALVSFQEGLPISLLEAMALGIPSISTNVNAIPEAIRHQETGWLIEPGDKKGLTEAFLELKNSAPLRSALGRRGREHVLKNFNEKVVAEIAFEGYREASEKY